MTTQITTETYDLTARAAHWLGKPEDRIGNFDSLDPELQEMFRDREAANIAAEFGEVDWAQVQSVIDAIAAQPETRQKYDEMLAELLRAWKRNPRPSGICTKIKGQTPATIDACRLAVLAS